MEIGTPQGGTGPRVRVAHAEQTTAGHGLRAIRCDHDGLKVAEIKDGNLILRAKHHGETHIKIVSLAALMEG